MKWTLNMDLYEERSRRVDIDLEMKEEHTKRQGKLILGFLVENFGIMIK